ncbi:uncharacterized protein LOC117650085 isoform X2 [Thrips palmi]|nr:uncharacterized protein LOC117650085 isoform X2 [Thrips palmi]
MEDHNPMERVLPCNATVREKFAEETCCLICLTVVKTYNRTKHKQTAAHKYLARCLKREIYPYPCFKCEMRFSAKSDLVHHSLEHDQELVIDENNQMFSPICCYLCRLPFKSEEELSLHCSTSVEHHVRRKMILEVALRECMALEILDNNEAKVELEESTLTSSCAVSEVQDQSTSLLSPPAKSTGHMGHCSICSVAVPVSNMTQHIGGKRHRENYEALLVNDIKSTCSSASGEILGCYQESGELLCSKSAPFKTVTGAEILATEETEKFKDYNPACSASLTDASEVKIALLSSNSNRFNAVGETSGSDQSDGDREIEMASRKPTVLAPLDLNNVAEDGLEESIQSSRSAISPVQEDPKANLLLTPSNQKDRSVDHQTYCSVCLVPVSKNNMSDHSKGKKHLQKYKALLATESKSTTASGEIFNSGQENSSKVPLHSLNKSSGTFPKTLDQSDGSGKIEIALRKPTVLALTDLNNVAEDRPENIFKDQGVLYLQFKKIRKQIYCYPLLTRVPELLTT